MENSGFWREGKMEKMSKIGVSGRRGMGNGEEEFFPLYCTHVVLEV